jgi:hypothetical protein
MAAWSLCERKNWGFPISCDVAGVAYDLHEVVVSEPGVIGVKAEMAAGCLHIDIPYPVHTQVKFPYPVQAAGTAEVFVEVFPGPVVS